MCLVLLLFLLTSVVAWEALFLLVQQTEKSLHLPHLSREHKSCFPFWQVGERKKEEKVLIRFSLSLSPTCFACLAINFFRLFWSGQTRHRRARNNTTTTFSPDQTNTKCKTALVYATCTTYHTLPYIKDKIYWRW